MEPLSFLLVTYVLGKMVTTHREDMEYARHGQESPRYKLKMARFKAAQQAGQAGARPPARPGAQGFLSDLWADSWDDLGEWRRRRRQASKEAAEQQRAEQAESLREWSKRSLNTGPDGRPVDDMLDVAGVRPEPAPHPHDPNNTRNCPECKGAVVVDGKPCPACLLRQQQRNAEYERQNGEPEWLTPDRDELNEPTAVEHDDQHPYCLEPCGPTCGPFGWVCGSCGVEKKHFVSRHEAEQAHRAHVCRTDAADLTADDLLHDLLNGLPGTAGHPNCGQCLKFYRVEDGRMVCDCTTSRPDPQPLADVIPLFPTTKEITMANAEATGLPTAIAYAEAAASAHETFATAGSEGYTNALEGFEVSGEALTTAREAQEASTIAAEKWRTHHEKLVDQMRGREFYQSNPDAGNKQFLAGE